MVDLQPQAVGTPRNPTRWCGTESGHPIQDVGVSTRSNLHLRVVSGPSLMTDCLSLQGGPIWSTGQGDFGDPNGTEWVPKFCDPQLFQEHVWFWEANLKVRTLGMMIPIYHDIVGRGMVMELAFSIDRDGLVEDTHAVV